MAYISYNQLFRDIENKVIEGNKATEEYNLLRSKGFVLEDSYVEDQTYLFTAAKKGLYSIVKDLISSGVDLEERSVLPVSEAKNNSLIDRSGLTALNIAVDKGYYEVVKELISAGADVNAISDVKASVLDIAVQGSDHRITNLLLDNGADINNSKNQNILARAIWHGHYENVKLLIEYGADVNKPDESNEPLDLAAEKGNKKVIDLLLSHGAKIQDFKKILEEGYVKNKFIKILFEGNAITTAESADGTPHLLTAFIKKKFEVADMLYQYGKAKVDKNVVDYVFKNLNKSVFKDLYDKGLVNLAQYKIVGVTNIEGAWSSNVVKFVNAQTEKLGAYYYPLSDNECNDKIFLSGFSGLINPGAGDTFPRDFRKFKLDDLNPDNMMHKEKTYQKVINIANEFGIPYLGICSGSQHLALNHGGYLRKLGGYNFFQDHTVHLVKGTIPYYMALSKTEKSKLLENCDMPHIEFKVDTAHNYAVVNGMNGKVKIGGFSEESVVEMHYFSPRQIGVQFHPENQYFDGEWDIDSVRKKNFLDSYYEKVVEFNEKRLLAEKNNISYPEFINGLEAEEGELVSRLEECAEISA